jgi:hypothetical protein
MEIDSLLAYLMCALFLTSLCYFTVSILLSFVFCLCRDLFFGKRLVAVPVVSVRMDLDIFVFDRLICVSVTTLDVFTAFLLSRYSSLASSGRR